MSSPNPKYRPYLTLHQIEYLLMRLTEFRSQDQEAEDISVVLSAIQFKASVGVATGSYTPSPRKTLESKLGFSDSEEMTPEQEAELLKQIGSG